MATISDFRQPVATVVGTGSYTVPAGKWARVLVNLSASARGGTVTFPSQSSQHVAVSGTTCNEDAELFLKSGDVLTSSLTNASGTLSAQSFSANAAGVGSASSTASIAVNGTTIKTCRANVTGAIITGLDMLTISFTGDTSYGFIALEYYNSF